MNGILVKHHQAYNYFQNQKNNDQNYISIFQMAKVVQQIHHERK
jgi:hypothetical protein